MIEKVDHKSPTPRPQLVRSESNRKLSAHSSWYRGDECHFGPQLSTMFLPDAIEKYILHGWTPEKPFISKDTKVVAFGSCFAREITQWLAKRKYNLLTSKEGPNKNIYAVEFGEGLVSTYTLLQQFEWSLEGKTFDTELWHGYDKEAHGYDESIRARTEAMFQQADVFIITLGLSEIWYDEVSGDVFWRAVPSDKFDPSRHKFRVATVSENRQNIERMIEVIRKHRPDSKIIFSLSPIPLVATFRANSCLTSNAASKASLRAAVDEIMRAEDSPKDVFYWPSYELVMDGFHERWLEDRRHIKPEILHYMLTLFETYFCSDSEIKTGIAEMCLKARIAEGTMPVELIELMDTGDFDTLSEYLVALNEIEWEKFELAKAGMRQAAERMGGKKGADFNAMLDELSSKQE